MTRARNLANLGNKNAITADVGLFNIGIGSTQPTNYKLDVVGGNAYIGGGVTITGNLSVGGTITYEDVTNVDAVGIITAAKGFRATAGGVVVTAGVSTFPVVAVSAGTTTKDLLVTGVSTFSGATTLSSTLTAAGNINANGNIVGDNSTNITGISAITASGAVATGALTVTGSTNVNSGHVNVDAGYSFQWGDSFERIEQSDGAIEFFTNNSEKMRLAGSNLGIGTTNPSWEVHAHKASGTAQIAAKNVGGNATFYAEASSGNTAKITLMQAGTSSYDLRTGSDDALQMYRDSSELLRIDSSGRLLLGTTTEGHANADDLTISGSGNQGITIRAGSTSTANIFFSDATSGTGEYEGMLYYDHNANSMAFATAQNTRITIDSSGRVLIGTGTSKSVGSGQYAKLNVEGGVGTTENFTSFSRNEAASAMSANDEVANLTFNDSAGYEFARIQVLCDAAPGATDTPGRIVFKTTADGASSSTNRLTIDKDGDVMMGNLAYNEGNALNVVSNTYDGIGVYRHSADASTPLLALGKSRGTSGGSTTVVQNDDYLGRIAFKGADGDEMHVGAAIDCQVDTTPGNNDMPARLVFSTVPNGSTTLTERLRIDSSGRVLIALNANHANASIDDLQVGNPNSSTQRGITIGSSDECAIAFSDAGDARAGSITYNHGSDAMIFKTVGQNERMRINSTGRVLIGTGAVSAATNLVGQGGLQVSTNGASGAPTLCLGADGTGANTQTITDNTAKDARIGFPNYDIDEEPLTLINGFVGDGSAIDGNSGARIYIGGGTSYLNAVNSIRFYTTVGNQNTLTGNERARIQSDGAFLINTTSSDSYHFKVSSAQQVAFINNSGTGDVVAMKVRHARGGLSGYSGKAVSFCGNDDSEEGSIVIGTTATAFNTSSDYRLKENQVAISDGITRLKQLKPYRFNFKKDPSVTVDGFFAHEVTPVVPQAVSGEKDAMAPETVYEEGDSIPSGKFVGDPKTYSTTEIDAQSVDYSKVVPLLTAALQEAVTKIETLEARLAALES